MEKGWGTQISHKLRWDSLSVHPYSAKARDKRQEALGLREVRVPNPVATIRRRVSPWHVHDLQANCARLGRSKKPSSAGSTSCAVGPRWWSSKPVLLQDDKLWLPPSECRMLQRQRHLGRFWHMLLAARGGEPQSGPYSEPQAVLAVQNILLAFCKLWSFQVMELGTRSSHPF
jgi:hypothetical protein